MLSNFPLVVLEDHSKRLSHVSFSEAEHPSEQRMECEILIVREAARVISHGQRCHLQSEGERLELQERHCACTSLVTYTGNDHASNLLLALKLLEGVVEILQRTGVLQSLIAIRGEVFVANGIVLIYQNKQLQIQERQLHISS